MPIKAESWVINQTKEEEEDHDNDDHISSNECQFLETIQIGFLQDDQAQPGPSKK